MPTIHSRLDVRAIAPQERHPAIFATFRALPIGQALELVNDHEPVPLRRQFELQAPGAFAWDVVEAGPDTWRVAITRTAEVAGAEGRRGCCGGCCGGA